MNNPLLKKYWFRPVIAFLIVFIPLSGFYLLFAQRSLQQSKERALAVAESETSTIRDRFDVIFARDYAMSNLIVSDQGSLDGIDAVAEIIISEVSQYSGISIKNIAVAPNGIVEKVYPVEGNEGLIGFNFMDETQAGNKEAIEAYKKGQLVVTNPFNLVQGGKGMGGRLPVYLGTGEDKQFWGLVTITLDYDVLLESLNLDALVHSGYNYKLWYNDEDGQSVILDASQEEPTDVVTEDFAINNLRWNLDLAPVNGWVNYGEVMVVFVAIMCFALLMAAIQLDKIKIQFTNMQLERLAHRDALTSCYSRQYVNTMLVNQRTGRWTDPELKYSMLMIDIDNFKHFNDTFGHEIGDRVIMAVAQVLLDNCKLESGDCVIRHGGDEYIVLYNDVTYERFEKKAEQILLDVRAIHFEDIPQLHVTVSIGGDYYISPEQSLYYEQIHRADEKLYQAKEQGRDQWCLSEKNRDISYRL
ncbi:MAG: diguanylate cyclase [Lachnospiraceae bacterium]|nr:diguanylate cyclase [Lachnospiraceae bacterium]MDD3617707.1 diguanylate cyclase [Lachnospiraceae bacterium]